MTIAMVLIFISHSATSTTGLIHERVNWLENYNSSDSTNLAD